MKKVLLLFVLVIVTRATLFAQTPVAKNGALHVDGSKILNEHGVEPQLRGISLSWSVWGGRKYYNPAVIDWLTNDFKVSILRVAMAVQPEHGYLEEPALQRQLVVNVVDQAIKDGIYVLIDWHDHHSNLHITQSKAFLC